MSAYANMLPNTDSHLATYIADYTGGKLNRYNAERWIGGLFTVRPEKRHQRMHPSNYHRVNNCPSAI